MTKIDIYSGFLGAGKTTLIKKMIKEAYAGEKLVLIENEFGEIGIDGGFLQEAGIEITEMNSGCICCSLVGDFGKALEQVIEQYAPDRILIEPSGVGKLSDVEAAVKKVTSETVVLGNMVTVADANKCKMYMKNFGEFYNNQVETAGTIILSRTDSISEEKLHTCVQMLKEKNPNAVVVTTPWDQLTGKQILDAMEQGNTMLRELEHEHHHHHEHHHDHDEHCTCSCHDHEHHEHHDHEHHHDHDEHCTCGCHDHDHHEHEHHHHEHDEHCTCGCHDHDHDHHHHHADEVFTSWGAETTKKFTEEEIRNVLRSFDEDDDHGMVLRAKGIVAAQDGQWIHFDYVPGETDIRRGAAGVTGRLCVIGSGICENHLTEIFGL
ncbi:MAG: GTP-binding protein [Oscillospiraceae bacterium]|nr:GTP-binding protein [Oscillospiraceae bacterium]